MYLSFQCGPQREVSVLCLLRADFGRLPSLLWFVADFEKRQREEGAVTENLPGPEWPQAAPRGPE